MRKGWTLRETVLGAAVFGFLGGWLTGVFLGLWAYATLGAKG